MRKCFVMVCLLCAVFLFVPCAGADEAPAVKGQSFNGVTGLYSVPTGHIGWDKAGNLGLDFGFRTIINEDGMAHIPSITASLFKWVEISTAFDVQTDINFSGSNQKNDDLLFGIKVRLPTDINNFKNSAIALGTNFQLINLADNDFGYNAIQPYAALSFEGMFFKMPAETTVVFGKTFYTGNVDNNSDIDFGMGVDLVLFPDVFKNFVHWIIDYANFSYSDNAWPNNLFHGTGSAWHRGILNTGFRIDMSAIPALSKFKFALDLVFNDLFDDGNRSFTAGAVFGISAL